MWEPRAHCWMKSEKVPHDHSKPSDSSLFLGKTLNKVNPNEVNLANVTSEEVDDLAGILKKALDVRRFHIKTEQVQEDEDDGAWDD